MTFSIPKAHRIGFLRFIRLSPQQAQLLTRLLKRASPASSLYEFSRQLSNENIDLSHDDAFNVVRFLAGLYRFRDETDAPAKQFLDDFVASAKDEVRRLPGLEKLDWSAVKKHLADMLQADQSLALTARASELSGENQHRLCAFNCRVLTDIRPVFLTDPSKDPTAVLVQHQLKIAYHEHDGAEVREFYVTMDLEDLLYLQYILIRAEEKDKSVRRMLAKAGTSVLGEDTSNDGTTDE
jgi:hypothetical protein